MKVTLYTLAACAVSRRLREFLARSGIPYDDRIVDREDGYVLEMFAHGFPVAVLAGPAGKEYVIGYQPDKIVAAVRGDAG